MPSELRFAKPVFGEVNIRVDLRKDRDKRENALLLLALRDLGLGICPLGDGNGIGRGFLKGKKLKIQKERELLAEIDFRTGKVIRGKELIEEYLSALH